MLITGSTRATCSKCSTSTRRPVCRCRRLVLLGRTSPQRRAKYRWLALQDDRTPLLVLSVTMMGMMVVVRVMVIGDW